MPCLLFNLIILAIICLARCAGKAETAPGDGAPRRPDRRAADHALCAVFLGRQHFLKRAYQFFFLLARIVLHDHTGKFFDGNGLHH